MKQTRMYVCTLEEFILVDIWDTLLYKLELSIELDIELNMHRKCSTLYTMQQWKRKDEIAPQMYN